MEKKVSRQDYSQFVVDPNKGKVARTYVNWKLEELEKDAADAIGLVVVHPNSEKVFYLKRCAGNHFFNPLDYTAGTKNDITYKDHRSQAEWVKVSIICYTKYLEFLKNGSRIALAKAEREYLSE
jgi:hypothetical protein